MLKEFINSRPALSTSIVLMGWAVIIGVEVIL